MKLLPKGEVKFFYFTKESLNFFQDEEPVVPKRGRPNNLRPSLRTDSPPEVKKTRMTRSQLSPDANDGTRTRTSDQTTSKPRTNEVEVATPMQRKSTRVKNQRGPITKVRCN